MIYDLKKLIEIRQYLHSIAELSGQEDQTSGYLISEIKRLAPDTIIENIGGFGFAAIFDSFRPGLTLCFRADLDALPIAETNDLPYQSKSPGTGHKCGHDGHLTILLGLAGFVKNNLDKIGGRIILLFQPAEETAQGALSVLADSRFTELKPDYIFGLHNLPGFPLGSVIIRDHVFAAASCGLKIKLLGKTSHAGHPENGNSPLQAMLDIVKTLTGLPLSLQAVDEATMVTIIHLRLGEIAFGTSPGEAEIMATFRSYDLKVLEAMVSKTELTVPEIAQTFNLQYEIEWLEKFASTVNDEDACTYVKKAAYNLKAETIFPDQPFRWTEDFSFFTRKYKAAFFGLGSGESHPQLHNPDYDFPDALIDTGISMFSTIIMEVQN